MLYSMSGDDAVRLRSAPRRSAEAANRYYFFLAGALGRAGLAHRTGHGQARLIGRDGHQLIVVVLLDDLDHVRIGVAAMAVADLGHLAQQVLVMLAGEHGIELVLDAFAVGLVALDALLLVHRLAVRDLLGGIGALVLAVVDRDAQALDVSRDVGQFLGVDQFLGKRIHGRVVAQAGANVGHLLDQHRGVLTRELREGAVGTTGAGGQVAGAADLIAFLAGLGIALLLQGLDLLALLRIPFVVLGFDAGLLLRRRSGQRERGNQRHRECHGQYLVHVVSSMLVSLANDPIRNISIH
jgi:hypothetical protein